jgi:hypothetical protein
VSAYFYVDTYFNTHTSINSAMSMRLARTLTFLAFYNEKTDEFIPRQVIN